MADNLKPVFDLVKEKLPFLSDGTKDELITSEILQTKYSLQTYLKKTDDEVESELEYKPLERILLAQYTAYILLKNKSLELTGGSDSVGTGSDNSFLKKAKADVVEAEFEQVDRNKTVTLTNSIEKLMQGLLGDLCLSARTLKINLPICACFKYDMIKPFTIIKC